MGVILDPVIKNQLYKVSSAAAKPSTPPTHQELSVALQTALKTGDWAPFARTIVQSSPMVGTAGAFGGPVSVTIQNPADDTPQSIDPMGHLKADVSMLGSGRTPQSKDEKKYEIAKALVETIGREDPSLRKLARASWSGGEIMATDEAQLKAAIKRLLAQQPELARELKQVFEV